MSTVSQFLSEIEAFLIAHGMAATKFGLLSVNDGHLVRKLRAGSRDIRVSRMDVIREWMRGFAAVQRGLTISNDASDTFRDGYSAGKEWGSTCSPAPRRRTSRRCAA